MLWILILTFVLAVGDPVSVEVGAEDVASCVSQGEALKAAFPEFQKTHLSDGNFTGMHWLCLGPNGEMVTDKD